MLALAVFLVVISPVAAGAPIDGWAFPLLAVAGLGAALLRRAPLVGFAVMLACTCAYLAAGQPDGPVYLAPLTGALGVWSPREQPISPGICFHAVPVNSTNTITPEAVRSGTRGRP